MIKDDDEVRTIARLSRIELSPDDLPAMRKEMDQVLKFVDLLKEVDTTGIEPMTSVVDMKLKMRADVVEEAADVLSNAPERNDNFFTVPKVIDD